MLVNTVSTDLELGKGGISKVLLKRGGQEIQDQCRGIKNFEVGQVVFTTGGKLKCKAIAHGALPEWTPQTSFSLRVSKK